MREKPAQEERLFEGANCTRSQLLLRIRHANFRRKFSQGIRDVRETGRATRRESGGSGGGGGGRLYVGREPGRLVISPGGVISWMQLPSKPQPLLRQLAGTRERTSGVVWEVGRG